MLKGSRRATQQGISTLEVLVAVLLIVLVVVFTWRIIGSTLAMLGSGNRDYQKAARIRTQAPAWLQATNEFTRSLGFSVCGAVPCTFWLPAASGPFAQAPQVPVDFACGRVLISDWDGAGPVLPAELRLVTIEVYRTRTACDDSGVGGPFIVTQTGLAPRQ